SDLEDPRKPLHRGRLPRSARHSDREGSVTLSNGGGDPNEGSTGIIDDEGGDVRDGILGDCHTRTSGHGDLGPDAVRDNSCDRARREDSVAYGHEVILLRHATDTWSVCG